MSSSLSVVYLRTALLLARSAARAGEIPVGAVIVSSSGKVLGLGRNATISRSDTCAHAEMLAISAAQYTACAPRIDGATLYVSLEPCLMCLGAAVHARIAHIVYAARSPKFGAWSVGGGVWLAAVPHAVTVECAADADNTTNAEFRECAHMSEILLKDFFSKRRKDKSAESLATSGTIL